MADFEIAVAKTIANEGGDKYTETPGDNGGGTKYGISSKFMFKLWMGDEEDLKGTPLYDLYLNCKTKDVIKSLTLEQAKFIYKKYFWDANRYGEIEDQYIAEKVFDMAVLMGAPQANKIVQYWGNTRLFDVLNVDGIIGDKTLYAINNKVLCNHLLKDMIIGYSRYFLDICNKDKSQSKFLLGWLNRVMS